MSAAISDAPIAQTVQAPRGRHTQLLGGPLQRGDYDVYEPFAWRPYRVADSESSPIGTATHIVAFTKRAHAEQFIETLDN